MKKKFIAVISFVLVLSLIIPVSASAKTFNWYCKHEKDGKQPGIDPEMKFIENYGGYYLDRKADENDKVIYLTFDAGYENGNVEKILDTMKTENVKVAFGLRGTMQIMPRRQLLHMKIGALVCQSL